MTLPRSAPSLRSRCALGLAAALGLVGIVGVASSAIGGGSAVDAALLTIEAPANAIASIKTLPPLIGANIETLEGRKIPPAVLAAASTATDAAYDAATTGTAIDAALAALPDAEGGAVLAAVADRFANAAEAQAAVSDPEEASRQFEALFAKRSDRTRIDELATLMAAPDLQGEVMLAAIRIEKALNVPHIAGAEKLAALDDAGIDAEVQSLVATTRQDSGETAEPFSRARGILEGQARVRAQLLALSEADVAQLHAFYSSPAGRAKRDALASTFAAQNDLHAAAMLAAYLKELRKPAP